MHTYIKNFKIDYVSGLGIYTEEQDAVLKS